MDTLAARLTPVNEADSRLASKKPLRELLGEARFVLGGTHYNVLPEVRQVCEGQDRFLVASGHRGPYSHT